MNILNLLTKEKHIVGIEINDRVVRIAYFSPQKKNNIKIKPLQKKLILIEEIIDENIIKDGIVIDQELLSKTLRKIWLKAKLSSHYAIVSIPEDKIYSHIFPFPKTVDETQLKEAINLAINFQLPVKKNDMYIGYENAGDSHSINEILISAISKNVADGYINALSSAGIKVLALESHLASIARSIKTKLGQATLFLKKSLSGATVFILKDSSIRFCRTIPKQFIKDDNFLEDEIDRIKASFESDKKTSVEGLSLTNSTFLDQYLKYPELNILTPELQSKWLIVVGAAMRGEIPRGKDNHISLLPVGTVEAYAYQKTSTFIALIRNMTIVVSIFFLLTFLGVYLFILSLSQINNKANPNITEYTPSADITKKEAWIKNINDMTSTGEAILSNTPTWNILLDDINSHVVAGILISNFTATSTTDPISIIGTAKDRDTLNLFKKSLQSSKYLTSVELPITNLEQKGDIPFSISFHLKDTNILYYK